MEARILGNNHPKIAYVSSTKLPNVRAQGLQISRMCAALSAAPRDITLFHRKRTEESITEDSLEEHYGLSDSFKSVQMTALTLGRPLYFASASSRVGGFGLTLDMAVFGHFAIRQALRQGFTRIYAREWQIAWLSTRRNISTTLELHEVPRSSLWRRFLIGLTQRDSLIKIVTISNGVRDGLLDIGIDQTKIFVAPDSVDVAAYHNLLAKTDARTQLAVDRDRPLVVYTGSLFHYKGVHTIIEAARILPEVDFMVVGGSGTELEDYRKAVKESGIQNITATGYQRPHKIPVFQAAADILIAPNTAENKLSTDFTSPLKLFEYMASGRPIVASSLRSIRDILRHESTAILVEPASAIDLASGISRVLNEPELSCSIVNRALSEVSSNTWNRRAAGILEEVGW